MKHKNKTNEKIIFILLILITTILIIVTIFNFFYLDREELIENELNLEKDSPEIVEKVEDVCSQYEGNQYEFCIIKNQECFDDQCYFEKANANQEERICFEIENEDLRAACSSQIIRNDIIERSILESNIEICEEFSFEDSIQHCRDNYNFILALTNDDKSFCEIIVDEVMKNECNEI